MAFVPWLFQRPSIPIFDASPLIFSFGHELSAAAVRTVVNSGLDWDFSCVGNIENNGRILYDSCINHQLFGGVDYTTRCKNVGEVGKYVC